jgi:hypothetical protein
VGERGWKKEGWERGAGSEGKRGWKGGWGGREGWEGGRQREGKEGKEKEEPILMLPICLLLGAGSSTDHISVV